ncbi:hypothetical protein EV702DRAFT_1203623 [Suillus placidus]|uniref:Uncharacterized protein n=1 Tax=Suillus placidus TaxID=48579 RepID=A0A9P6ZJ81_9AGAM|nr:hypothetical protein EV702DRAFT_1203623 [Suillus placidus]
MTPPQSSVNSNDALPSLQSEQKLITLSATRTWSTSNSTVAVSGSDIKRKPDLVLSDDIKPKWGNIRYKPAQRIVKAADTQAYLLLSNQSWRRFTFILSFTNQYRELWVLSPECIGYDSMVTFWKNVPLPPPPGTNIPDYRPFKNLPTHTNWSITLPAEYDSEPLTALHKDPQELPTNHEAESTLPSGNDLEPISPFDDSLESIFNENLEFLEDPIEELPASPSFPSLPSLPPSFAYSAPTPCGH